MLVSRTSKFRGRNRTHGRGRKAGRGAGKRGGRGLAGINKHRVMTRIIHMPDHWGRHGFNRNPGLRTVHTTMNVSEVCELAGSEGSFDLQSVGATRLLGSGRIDKAIVIRTSSASARAIAKVEAAGGSVELIGKDEE